MKHSLPHLASLATLVAASTFAQTPIDPITPEQLKEEAVIFTPPGFAKVGDPKWAGTAVWVSGVRTGFLEIVVRDAASGAMLPARVNVVGPDGNFYQPPPNPLERFALTGTFPNAGFTGGNRIGKAPYRYLGRFFYIPGETKVQAMAGKVRVEVWRGYEFRPQSVEISLPPGGTQRVEIKLVRAAAMAPEGYYAGDTHLHRPRLNPADDDTFLGMMDLEDIRYAVDMSDNQVGTARYAGFTDAQMNPQRALGHASIVNRGDLHLISGQEYRSRYYGHLNISLRDDLVLAGTPSLDTDTWPVFGLVARETIDRGGFAFMAHGGYEQEFYADAALGNTSGLELLQFGIYRHIGLENWYHMLNAGYRIAAHGASDYPGTRFLSDCRTYVHSAKPPTIEEWLAGVAAGRSFLTSGPMLLLEVNGQKPGAQIKESGTGPHRVIARVRMRCEVTPVTDLDLIVNGQIAKTMKITAAESNGHWIELDHTIELTESSWIAARAHSLSPGGQPDAEAHTNPVYVYLNGRAPFNVGALGAWLAKIDGQMAIHAKRDFPEFQKVWGYFQRARDALVRIKTQGGLTDAADPAKPLPNSPAVIKALSATRPRTPAGISERDVAVASEEVSDEAVARSRSLDRGARRDFMGVAPERTAKQLQQSLERHPTLDARKQRSEQIREEFLKAVQLWPLPAKAPLNPILHSRRDYDGYSVENIAIESMPGFYCTGNLYRPLNATKPGAGVLCPHGHFQPLGRFREEHQIRCAQLARMGATVFSYSMVGWHDSMQAEHRDPLVLALQTLNAIAAIDYLCSLPGVDPKRIGVTGASGGGTQTLYAALLDDRVAASCPVGSVYWWMEPLGCLCEAGLPIMQAAATNGIETAAAVAPRAQLFISIGGDNTRDFPQTGFPFVRRVYELYGRGQAVQNAHFADEKHDYGPSKRQAMYAFFTQQLALTPLPENTSRITIERVQPMEVFNDAHPLPAHAVRCSEEVARVFRSLPRAASPTAKAR